jgi:hypothetical protein
MIILPAVAQIEHRLVLAGVSECLLACGGIRAARATSRSPSTWR